MDIKEKNGVKYFFDNGEAATDIEVAPEVEELMLKYSLQMPKSKKSFPNVKKLIIEKDVLDIKIPNTLLPNVREVVSHTETFLSGKYLLKKDGFTYLKNVLCPDKDDTIVLSQIYAIDARAFAGCECVNLERTENVIIITMARKTAANSDAYCLDLRVRLSVGCKRRYYFFFLYLPVFSYLRL